MTERDRNKTRIAHIIRDQVAAVARQRTSRIEDLATHMAPDLRRLQRLQAGLQICGRRGWVGAARRLMRQLNEVSTVLTGDAQQLAVLTDIPPRSTPPSMRAVGEDLDQLDGEFDGWDFNRRQATLSVRTSPITLQGVYLGPFRITLRLGEISSDSGQSPYSCVALDPHPAAGNDHITHPHVSDDGLCEGDAAGPIRAALESGRIADFFLIVRSVLTTYNDGSPYVPLDRWGGDTCEECDHVSADDLSTCSGCDRAVCDDCLEICTACDRDRCTACLDRCTTCEEPVCETCMTRCERCREGCCKKCLDDGLCRACMDKETTNHENPEPSVATSSPAPAAVPAA